MTNSFPGFDPAQQMRMAEYYEKKQMDLQKDLALTQKKPNRNSLTLNINLSGRRLTQKKYCR